MDGRKKKLEINKRCDGSPVKGRSLIDSLRSFAPSPHVGAWRQRPEAEGRRGEGRAWGLEGRGLGTAVKEVHRK